MSPEVLAGLIAGAVTLATLIIKGLLTRQLRAAKASIDEAQAAKGEAEAAKGQAEAEAARAAAVYSQIEPLHRIIATLDARLADSQKEIQRNTERIAGLHAKLELYEEQVGVLTRREREFLEYRAAAAAYEQLVSTILQQAGLPVPDPPVAPSPRAERTRRTDGPHDG